MKKRKGRLEMMATKLPKMAPKNPIPTESKSSSKEIPEMMDDEAPIDAAAKNQKNPNQKMR